MANCLDVSLQQIVSSIYYPNAILKNLSEQDIFFDSQGLIDSERNAVVIASNWISAVEEATYNLLIGYEDFLWTKKQQAIFGSMVAKSSRQPYARQEFGLIQPWPLRQALEGAPMDVIHHSKIGTQNAMTWVTNHVQVLLNLMGRSEHFCPHDTISWVCVWWT